MKLKVFKGIKVAGVVIGVAGFMVGLCAAMMSDGEQFTGVVRSHWFYFKLVVASIMMMAGGYGLNAWANNWVRYLTRRKKRERTGV